MSKIEWTEKTWNPVTGCDKVSQGCKNCYAETMHRRLMVMHPHKYSKPFLHNIQLHEEELVKPLLVDKPTTWFVNSMSDLFHKDVPFEFIVRVFIVMALCPHHTFQVLTKRADVALDFFRKYPNGLPEDDRGIDEAAMEFNHLLYNKKTHELEQRLKDAGWFFDRYNGDDSRLILEHEGPLPNVWIGVSCEDQQNANERIPLLLQMPAAIRFVSCEPLIGRIDLRKIDQYKQFWMPHPDIPKDGSVPAINWVITGGESGRKGRPVHPDWIRSLRDQCKEFKVPFFFKQWGNWLPLEFDVQPPYRSFSNDGRSIDAHLIDLYDEENDRPGKYEGRTFMDSMDAVVLCVAEKESQCDFLAQGHQEKFEAKLDGRFHHEMPAR